MLGSVLLMGSGAFDCSLLMARWIDSKALTHYFPIKTDRTGLHVDAG